MYKIDVLPPEILNSHYEQYGDEVRNLLLRVKDGLMQLKMGHWVDDYHQIHDQKELVQLELYEWWPKFVFKYRPMVAYDIMPKSVTPGAQYLFVNRHEEPLFTHAVPSQIMFNDADYSLGRFLVAFTQ